MHLLNSVSLLSLLLLVVPTLSSKLTITIPPSPLLPNPHSLPADTHATLTSRSLTHPLKAPLTRSATFVFRDIPAAVIESGTGTKEGGSSYLLDIRSTEYVFAPLRVDVDAEGVVRGVWETFRGNEWGNTGPEKYTLSFSSSEEGGNGKKGEEVIVDAKVIGRKGFYEVRQTFSPLSLFKNPMILLALVALGFTFGMPKLMENMDPEMRAEFEKQSRASPMAGAQNAMAGGGAANFDLAGWMAGAAPRGNTPVSGSGSGATGASTGRENRGARRR